jgi:hypothetical protein
MQRYMSDHNAIRGFRRTFPHLAHLGNEIVRADFLDCEADGYRINLEAVADYETERFGELKAARLEGVPTLRRSLKPKGATARVKAFFAALPANTPRREAIMAAVDNGFAYCTARTQYSIWKAAN